MNKSTRTKNQGSQNRGGNRNRETSNQQNAGTTGASRSGQGQQRSNQEHSDWREGFRGGYGNSGTMSRAGWNRGGVGAGYDEPRDQSYNATSDYEDDDFEGREPTRSRASEEQETGRTRGSWAERGFNPRGSTGGFYGREYGWTTRGETNRNERETGRYSGLGPRGYQRPDERVYEEVCDLLTENGDIDASNIDVRCESGEVILEGTVPDRETKRLAEDIAESARGVRDVRNNLRIEPSAMGDDADEDERGDAREYGASSRGRAPGNRSNGGMSAGSRNRSTPEKKSSRSSRSSSKKGRR